MINIRLSTELIKDGSTYTLVNIRINADNVEDKKSAQAVKGVENQFTNVSSLFSAIESETVALVQSGLV